MRDISREVIKLVDHYQGDLRKALQENSKLEYLYALSEMRENLLEWYPFSKEGALLQVGSDYGAMTGLYSRKVKQVVVLDENEQNLEANRLRHGLRGNVDYINQTLEEYAKEPGAANVGSAGDAGTEEMEEISGNQGGCPGRFDYVVMIGSLKPNYEKQLAAAKALLKPNGVLMVAVCNQFGMKYWAGAKKDDHSFSYKEITRLISGNGEGELKSYYPMPDYKIPTSIYSEDHLPKKGDLTDTVIAYDYPRYLLTDVGAGFDAVCEDGQFENFANSFLLIWRNHGRD